MERVKAFKKYEGGMRKDLILSPLRLPFRHPGNYLLKGIYTDLGFCK